MKLSGCLIAESVNIYLTIRSDTINGCLINYLALQTVAKADMLMAMTLPSTEMKEKLSYQTSLGINDDFVEARSWEWTKETFFQNLGLILLVIINRVLRFVYVTVYFYFMPFFAIVAADLCTRSKVKIEGDFVVPS